MSWQGTAHKPLLLLCLLDMAESGELPARAFTRTAALAASDVRAGTTASNFQEEVIDVPLTREEAVVSKEAHVTGAVRVAKTSTAETQTVSDSVHKEDVEVIREGKTVTERTDLKK